MTNFLEISLNLIDGFWVSIKLFILTLLFSLPLGLVICFLRRSKVKVIEKLTKVFIWIIRGTPLMLQILVVFYIPGILFDAPIFASNRFLAALITFVINYACYFAEIYRGGIESISKGQYEAGEVLGLTDRQIFFKVILLQLVKRILPPISNEVITLVKDTALVRVISVIEVIKVAERYTAQGLIWPLFYTGIYYLIFNGILTLLFSYFEKKLDYIRS